MQKIFSLVLSLVFLFFTFVAQAEVSSDKVGVFGLENIGQARELGVGWTRIPLLWSAYEKDKDNIEKRLNSLKDVNVVVTIRSVHRTKTQIPIWARSFLAKHPNVKKDASCPPKDIDQYKNFIREVVRRNKNKVAAWQIENEIYLSKRFWAEDKENSIEQFFPVLKAASEVIREEDPGKPILAPGIAFPPAFDIEGDVRKQTKEGPQILASGLRELFSKNSAYFDVVDVHLYNNINKTAEKVSWVKDLMQEAGIEKPIWATEISSYTRLKNIKINDEFKKQQARELKPRLQAALDAGVEKVFYFRYRDSADNPNDIANCVYGLVTKGSVKKPAYKAMQEFTGKR